MMSGMGLVMPSMSLWVALASVPFERRKSIMRVYVIPFTSKISSSSSTRFGSNPWSNCNTWAWTAVPRVCDNKAININTTSRLFAMSSK